MSSRPRSRRAALAATVWFAGVAAFALASRAEVTARRGGRCSLDGVTLGPRAAVELVHGERTLARFCCVTCATEWPEVPRDGWWRVFDEVTGEPLDAERALFVESGVPVSRARRDHVHAFAALRDALAHAEAFGGQLIARPLPAGATAASRHDTLPTPDAAHDTGPAR